ncbi:MAG: helix-turn-helix domain-containing protein [Ferruginibacter sp.]|nr:helix-turn-helix domain-containing protein [Chitinophagaceae bacterium]
MKDLKPESRIKTLRIQAGFSQEELASKTQLSLRTIQRIENRETVPRGDSLQRISKVLNFKIADLNEQPVQKQNTEIILLLHFSVLAFLIFPLLGVIFPLILWLLFKDKISDVRARGITIIKSQIYWLSVLAAVYLYIFCLKILNSQPILPTNFNYKAIITGIYLYNLIIVLGNIIKTVSGMRKHNFKPVISF